MDNASVLLLCLLLSFALLINLPLGYLRQRSRRYSFIWFTYIHLSIPLIIVLRIVAGFSWRIIPLTIGCAVAGQILGGRIYRRRHP